MNFHISNLSPLRPQFSSSSLGASRSQPAPRLPSAQEATDHHDATGSAPSVRIAVEPADELSSNTGTDDDIDDDDTDSLSDMSADDVTQDSRDVLVQRLTDLAERIGGANVRTSCIEALHKQVDEMERVLRGGSSRDRSTSRKSHLSSSSPSSRRTRGSLPPGSGARPKSLQLPAGQGGGDVSRGRESLGIMAPMSPSWLMSHFQRRPSVHQQEEEEKAEQQQHHQAGHPDSKEDAGSRAHLDLASSSTRSSEPYPSRPSVERMVSVDSSTTSAPRISSQVAEDAIKEAEKLCAEMATVIESLQTRRQESDVMPSLLIPYHVFPPPPTLCPPFPSSFSLRPPFLLRDLASNPGSNRQKKY